MVWTWVEVRVRVEVKVSHLGTIGLTGSKQVQSDEQPELPAGQSGGVVGQDLPT